jgi:hypothetical protein
MPPHPLAAKKYLENVVLCCYATVRNHEHEFCRLFLEAQTPQEQKHKSITIRRWKKKVNGHHHPHYYLARESSRSQYESRKIVTDFNIIRCTSEKNNNTYTDR